MPEAVKTLVAVNLPCAIKLSAVFRLARRGAVLPLSKTSTDALPADSWLNSAGAGDWVKGLDDARHGNAEHGEDGI